MILGLRLIVSLLALCLIGLPSVQLQTSSEQTPFNNSQACRLEKVGPALTLSDFSCYTGNGLTDSMTGRVLIHALFVDSDGSYDPDEYDWTAEAVNRAAAELDVQLNGIWKAAASDYDVNLRFTVQPRVAVTGYEPVRHSFGDREVWISDVAARLGFSAGSAVASLEAFARQSIAGSKYTRSAVVFFLANDTAGRNQVGGICGVAPGLQQIYCIVHQYGQLGCNSPAIVATHEIGHVFYAFDEYGQCRGSIAPVIRPAAENRNCIADNPRAVPCIMGSAFAEDVCSYTASQVGWISNIDESMEITKVKCKGCTRGRNLLLKGPGLDPSSVVYFDSLRIKAGYQPTTGGLLLTDQNLVSGSTHIIEIKRCADGQTYRTAIQIP